jgi:perosamine synthetase
VNIFIQRPKVKNFKNVYWVVGILILNNKVSAKELSLKLLKKGIQTRPFFYPMNKQKILSDFLKKDKDKYPNSEHISKYGLYLPSYFDLKTKDVEAICHEINALLV